MVLTPGHPSDLPWWAERTYVFVVTGGGAMRVVFGWIEAEGQNRQNRIRSKRSNAARLDGAKVEVALIRRPFMLELYSTG